MLNRSQVIYLIVACLLFTALIGLIPLLVPELMLGARAIPTLLLMLVIAIILMLATLKAAQETDGREKRKRSEGEVERYTVIQHFVDDLDTDERDYLRQLLNEQDAESTSKLSRLLEAEADEMDRDEILRS